MIVKSATFVTSSTKHNQCPESSLPEYAFIGRSNVGKSSLINMITGRKKLAKISGTPGKTQLINHFLINEQWYLVDLPGYGFAKISKKIREDWEKMIKNYLLYRENLRTTFLLVDSRHEPQASDMDFINWFGEHQRSFVLLFTKTDKLGRSKLTKNLDHYSQALSQFWDELPVSIITSSVTALGKEQILDLIGEMNEDSN